MLQFHEHYKSLILMIVQASTVPPLLDGGPTLLNASA